MSERPFTAYRVYDPNGLQVTFSFPLPIDTVEEFAEEHARAAQRAVAITLASGFTASPPDAKEGEKIFDVWYVVRRAKINDDGSETPIIDFYAQHEKMNFKFFSHYLNTEEDVQSFEAVAGLKLLAAKLYDGESALQKESGKFKQYALECPKHPKVALTTNPYYNPDEPDVKKRKPQFKFSRWIGAAATGDGSGDPKAGTGTGTGTTGSGSSGSTGTGGGSGDSGDGSIVHWAVADENRMKIARVFQELGIKGQTSILMVMRTIEPGINKMTESKAKSVDEYIRWLNQWHSKQQKAQYKPGDTFVDEDGEIHIIQADGSDYVDKADPALPAEEEPGYRWTKANAAKFTEEILKAYPGLTAKTLFGALGTDGWVAPPEKEREFVRSSARDEGWEVLTAEVRYVKGASKDKSYFAFKTAIGEVYFFKGATEFTRMVGGGWARANGVAEWRELDKPRSIEPLILSWEAKLRESDGSEYLIVTGVKKTDSLDEILEGDDDEDDIIPM